jgi:RNA polymerase sigma factor (sigma-70 family)
VVIELILTLDITYDMPVGTQQVGRYSNGDSLSIDEMYKLHAPSVYNTIYRLVKHTAEAEDILQESFITAYQKLHTFEHQSSVKTWITRIAINKAVDTLRRNKHQFVDIEIPDNSQETDIDEEDFAYQVDEVKKAIMALSPGYRTVASLYLIDDIPQAEIGQILGITHSTVRTQYKKAKAKILEYIKDERTNKG